MAEIGKYGFQIINVVLLRYIELKCAICYKCVPSSLESKQSYLKAPFFMKMGRAIQQK